MGMVRQKLQKAAYESVAFRAASVPVVNDDGFEDLPELLKVSSHCVYLGLPWQTANKYFCVRCIAELTGL